MPPFDAAPDYQLFSGVLRNPDRLIELSATEYSRVIDAAQAARLLGWLLARGDERRAPANTTPWLSDRLAHCRAYAREYERALTWEIGRLSRAFAETDVPWVLLKGAAYVAASLPPGRGRRVADIDVLVPAKDLQSAEQALRRHGWEPKALDAYDERYYREWMHELPPMVHRTRQSVVDLHHAILPRTSRLRPSSERLLERAIVTSGGERVLCPSHMILHASAHLFHDGEVAGALRDLVDLDELLRVFGSEPAFWGNLTEEAAALDLTRPFFYTLRYARRWFDTPIPSEVMGRSNTWAPPALVLGLMDALVERTLPTMPRRPSPAAAFALYVRSHWLRMPPGQLVRHLARKSWPARSTNRVL